MRHASAVLGRLLAVGVIATAIAACDRRPGPDAALSGRAASSAPAPTSTTRPAPSAVAAKRPAPASPSANGAGAPPAPARCTRSVKLDLVAWQNALARARDATQKNALLTQLALGPVDSGAQLRRLDVEKAALAGDARTDRIVVARFHDAERKDSMRVQVLRAQGPKSWCVVESELSTDQDLAGHACLGGDRDDPPVSVATVHLLDATRDTLRVVTEEGRCDGCGRAGHYELAYYDASGYALRKIYTLALYDTTYSGCPFPPVEEELGSHELVGDFPRTIVATLETVCHKPGPGLPDEYKRACSPKIETIQSEYKDGTYVATVHSSRDGTEDSRLALADSNFRDARRGAGWGDRCLLHLKAGELEYARAACEHGLADKPADATRGALYYNLALVEQAAGDADAACRNLERSLIARPKNAFAREKARELACKP